MNFKLGQLILLLLAAAACASADAQAPRGVSDPYKGDLSIFEKPDRDAKLQTDRVLDLLGIKAGSHVADIGAGSGWFSVRAARRVGKTGAVQAVDINPAYLRYIRRRAAKENLPNIHTILGRPDDPLLPKRSLDVAVLLKTYHEVAQPVTLLRHVREALQSGGRLAIIDRNGIGTDHGLNADVVIKEAAEAGFVLDSQHDFVKAEDLDY
ncbi:MAG: methyltransferase domain-containing protein, partial [Verrucomicrobiota bacterium]|nr:methyltransferase domain-containing protein [Verrucomicrobiota bacterium]